MKKINAFLYLIILIINLDAFKTMVILFFKLISFKSIVSPLVMFYFSLFIIYLCMPLFYIFCFFKTIKKRFFIVLFYLLITLLPLRIFDRSGEWSLPCISFIGSFLFLIVFQKWFWAILPSKWR